MKFKIKKSILLLLVILMSLTACDENVEKSQLENVNENVITNTEKQEEMNQDEIEPKEKILKIKGKKQVGDIEIDNIQITLVGERKCRVTADVKNLSKEFLNSNRVKIKAINEDGEVEEIFGGIITELAGYEPCNFVTYVYADITDIKDIEFEVEPND